MYLNTIIIMDSPISDPNLPPAALICKCDAHNHHQFD